MSPQQPADPARGSRREGFLASEALLAQAVGGWSGLFDSALPSAVFLVTYLVTGQQLTPSVWAAVVAGALVAVWRLVRRQSVQQVVGGFVGVAVCAWLASRTGRAEDFYLPGLLLNAGYAALLAISALIGRPIVGYIMGALTGDLTGWRQEPVLRRACSTVTWMFAAMFVLRLVVQIPLYYAGLVAALGVARLAMGYPLYGATLYLAYRIIARARSSGTSRKAAVPELEGSTAATVPPQVGEQTP